MQKGGDGDGVYRKVLMVAVVVVCAERKESWCCTQKEK